MIRLILLFILLTVSSQLALGDDIKRILIQGEIENPGPMKFEENMTLGNLMAKKAIPLPVAATNRIRILRSGKSYSFNLKLNPDIIIKSSDLITVPPKSFYENQASEQEYRFEVPTKTPLKSHQQIIKIKIKGVKCQQNSSGFEFRPTGKTLREAWSRVVIQTGTDSIKVFCRCEPNYGKPHEKLPYQIELEKKIRVICASETE